MNTPAPTYTRHNPVRTVRPATACPPDLVFRPLTPDTLPLVNSLLQTATSRTCDYTVGGIYMWIEKFAYTYCVLEDTLFLRGVSEADPRLTAFSLPIGPMPLARAVATVRRYCHMRGITPRFSAIPEDRIDYLLSTVTDACPIVTELDDWADYLYDIRSLATLTGKKWAKKRNHVNRFMADNPGYTFEHLDYTLVPEALLFITGLQPSAEHAPADYAYERAQCVACLQAMNSYPFEWAVLRDNDGAICALTAGEVLGDTLYVHIEKMNHTVAGAGETVNRLFAAGMLQRHPALRYVNREEDCGDPGLRHAKLSYNPVMRLRKFDIAL